MNAAKEDDPCTIEKELAHKCLDTFFPFKNCRKYVLNLRLCREFWTKVKNERREAGIHPILPPPEERERIIREKFKS